MLANNVTQHSLVTLLTKPLDANQGAPLGFLFLAKGLVCFLGNGELALRFVALMSGVLTLSLAYRLSLSFLRSIYARICLVGLVSFSPVLVYYSTEFKQYSLDVLISLLILWSGLNFQKWRRGYLIFALVGGIGILLSHPSVFILTAVGIILLFEAIAKKEFKSLLALGAVMMGWAACWGGIYLLSLHFLAHNDSLMRQWSRGYAPVPIRSTADLYWYWESALGLVHLAYRQLVAAGVTSSPQWFDGLNILLLVGTMAGMICLFVGPKRLFGFVSLTVTVTLFASALRLYPFRARLVLFLVPLVFIAASSLVDRLATCCGNRFKFFATASTACLLMLLLAPSVKISLSPHNDFDIKGALDYVRSHRSPVDTLALSDWSNPAFSFYARQFGFDDMRVAAYVPRDNNPEQFLQTICRNPPLGRTWIVFSHRFDERVAFLAHLRSLLPQLDSWEGNGAGVYLFDFSNTNLCSSFMH